MGKGGDKTAGGRRGRQNLFDGNGRFCWRGESSPFGSGALVQWRGVGNSLHPTPLDNIVLYSSKRGGMVCLVTSGRGKDFGEGKKSLPSSEVVCTPCFYAVFRLRKKSASFGNSLHPVFRCRQSILRLQTTAPPHQAISTAARRLRRQKTF